MAKSFILDYFIEAAKFARHNGRKGVANLDATQLPAMAAHEFGVAVAAGMKDMANAIEEHKLCLRFVCMNDQELANTPFSYKSDSPEANPKKAFYRAEDILSDQVNRRPFDYPDAARGEVWTPDGVGSLPQAPERVVLGYHDGTSDKVYEVEMKKEAGGHQVTFAYGRRGGNLTKGTKTPQPVDEAEAREIFTALVEEKEAKGYVRKDPNAPDVPEPVTLKPSDPAWKKTFLDQKEEIESSMGEPVRCPKNLYFGFSKDGEDEPLLFTVSTTKSQNQDSIIAHEVIDTMLEEAGLDSAYSWAEHNIAELRDRGDEIEAFLLKQGCLHGDWHTPDLIGPEISM